MRLTGASYHLDRERVKQGKRIKTNDTDTGASQGRTRLLWPILSVVFAVKLKSPRQAVAQRHQGPPAQRCFELGITAVVVANINRLLLLGKGDQTIAPAFVEHHQQ